VNTWVFIADVGFELGGRSNVRYLVLQIHYKFASSGLIDYTRLWHAVTFNLMYSCVMLLRIRAMRC